MWMSEGFKFVSLSAFSPLGMAVLMAGFVVSCGVRVFLRNRLLRQLYFILCVALLMYLAGLVVVVGVAGSTLSVNDWFVVMLFSMFFGIPCSVGWLLGWLVAVALQIALGGPVKRPGAEVDEQPGQTC